MSRRHRSRLARGSIDWREPLTDHALNAGRQFWFLPAPGRFGGPFAWDVVEGALCKLTGFTSGYGWSPQSYPGGAGSISFSKASGPTYVLAAADQPAWATGNVFSLACWLNYNSSATLTFQNAIEQRTDVNNGWQFGLDSASHLYFGVERAGTLYQNRTSFTVSTNVWQHWVATYNAGTLALYQNGRPVSLVSSGNGLFINTTTLRLGGGSSGSNQRYTGLANDVSLWGRVLSSMEAALLYQLGPQVYPGVLRRRGRVAYSVAASGGGSSAAKQLLASLGCGA